MVYLIRKLIFVVSPGFKAGTPLLSVVITGFDELPQVNTPYSTHTVAVADFVAPLFLTITSNDPEPALYHGAVTVQLLHEIISSPGTSTLISSTFKESVFDLEKLTRLEIGTLRFNTGIMGCSFLCPCNSWNEQSRKNKRIIFMEKV